VGHPQSATHRPVYHLAAVLTTVYCGNLFLYTVFSGSVPTMLFPSLLYASILAVLLLPTDALAGDLRVAFLRYGAAQARDAPFFEREADPILRRDVCGNLRRATWRIVTAPFWVVTFADILLADVFTSFAKVLAARTSCPAPANRAADKPSRADDVPCCLPQVGADLETPLCMILSGTGLEYDKPLHAGCNATAITPLVLRHGSLGGQRQDRTDANADGTAAGLSDHQRTQPAVGLAAAAVPAAVPRREPERTNAASRRIPYFQWRAHTAHSRAPTGGETVFQPRHLANALKYSTAFPVILLSALQRGPVQSDWAHLYYNLW